MVKADTVIGIAGAILLLAIMAGVFMYEFQAADPEPDSRQAFLERYPALDPDEDIDGDGVPNHEDHDIDGDGVPNEEDDDVVVVHGFEGTLAAHVGSAQSAEETPLTFFAGTGNLDIHVEMEYSVTLPLGLPQPLLVLELVGPGGDVAATGQTEYEGQQARVQIHAEAGLEAGEYTVRVRNADNSVSVQDTPFSGTVTIAYDA